MAQPALQDRSAELGEEDMMVEQLLEAALGPSLRDDVAVLALRAL